MNSIKESSFVNSLILLNSISIDNHYQWLLDKEKEYIEATYNFMQYLKGYHNKKEYSQIRENIMQAYIKLHDRAEYKIKVETILERLAIEYEIDESNNISLKQPKQRNKLII
jgi:Cu/Ag efflux pump CusA